MNRAHSSIGDHEEALMSRRVEALEKAFEAKGLVPENYFDEFHVKATQEWSPENGARVVARCWTDTAFRERLLGDAIAAVAELGYSMPEHQRKLIALEDTPNVHNVIVCTLCSCTAFTLLGVAPHWYKDLEYRARIVREARTVLREMGTDLPEQVEIRVWDTTADTRYIVIPARPAYTQGWSEAELARIVTKESMIGVSRLDGIGKAPGADAAEVPDGRSGGRVHG
ncbi:MAG TPA: nitrile hydratase subunit alpha [Burkholderiaceae bacterium]|nr:nitrile hydratase subunit alpha [Burkholderiaceae bacterium]